MGQTDAISRSAVLAILENEFNMAAEEREDAENEKDRAFNSGEIHCARRSTRKVAELPAIKIDGNTSDGYHTFNELYDHRAKLFSVIVRDHSELCWKSKLHHDGTMYDGMFIVGINTPQGQASYHYDIDPYWDLFQCKEMERAPEWDGHTSEEAINRIAALGVAPVVHEKDIRSSVITVKDSDEWQDRIILADESTQVCAVYYADDSERVPVVHARWGETEIVGYDGIRVIYGFPCGRCGQHVRHIGCRWCPWCGARMDGEADGDG